MSAQGMGRITRYHDGRPTRFTFKKPFDQTPHVQITPDFAMGGQLLIKKGSV
ncbi:hypothetical protein EYZ11_009021 [Aspergillus tanneri]|uniref:Uncharacterized protein n=1 Tax=Aspergillus tanneri TaxID=1220188 RepID=A0A4S3J8Y4_9EURO|nr:hypothetical protein EYZ11_009021 [Aspergillus tanneri]